MRDLRKLTDELLVKEYVAGNSKCIDVLIDRHKNKIFTYILVCVKQRELAEDIFQDTIVKVIHSLKAGRYSENGKFSSWVMRIGHNLIIDHYRKEKHLSTISNDNFDFDLFNHPKYSAKPIEDKIVYDQILKDVAGLVALLPESQKRVVELRHYKGLSFKEISEELGVSINTALGRMRYAIINLRKYAREKNISLSIS
ncbi:MAG: sigma-70 family RNA polymerase sigma factor [Chlorobi bacterium]|nr:sigma-70 family RNA polymerase sigma factor [Chlorobiota bacterium]